MTYGAIHRFFLRTVASRGVITFSDAENILRKTCPDRTTISIENLTKEINDQIRQFQQTIKIVIDEVTSEKNVVFLSLGFDDATKSQNVFTTHELDFFRLLIEQIMATESRQITSQNALNLVTKLKLSKSDAQNLLTTWCRMYYLEKINFNYALGIRAIHEFRDYLNEYMPNTINGCCLCKENVFRGYNCPACGEAVHTRCLNLYLEKVKKWPCCKADFNQAQLDMLNSEGMSQTQQIVEDPQASRLSAQASQLSRLSVDETLELSDDDFEETQLTIPGVSQRVSRKRKRKTRD